MATVRPIPAKMMRDHIEQRLNSAEQRLNEYQQEVVALRQDLETADAAWRAALQQQLDEQRQKHEALVGPSE